MRSLYVTQNGMAEGLGQAQVLPYLRGLAARGFEIDLVSYELATLATEVRHAMTARMKGEGIHWHPLIRKMPGSLPVKVLESANGVLTALRTALRRPPDIFHGRGYMPTAIADLTQAILPRTKLLFDCRGMLGDEYVDGGYWTKDRLEYRLLKQYERRLFRRPDGIVVLTNALRRWLEAESGSLLGSRPSLEVIPCCVDLERFRPDDDARHCIRAELGVGDRVVILYSGSLGSKWYLELEMAQFANALRRALESAGKKVVFVCLTPSNSDALVASLGREGFTPDDVIVRKVPPAQMTAYLNAGDIGLSFIMGCFSKKGSSPTKVAEYLACGNIAVVNGEVGDQADLVSEPDSCVVLAGVDARGLEAGARRTAELVLRPHAQRVESAIKSARKHFGLQEVGVARYAALYERLMR